MKISLFFLRFFLIFMLYVHFLSQILDFYSKLCLQLIHIKLKNLREKKTIIWGETHWQSSWLSNESDCRHNLWPSIKSVKHLLDSQRYFRRINNYEDVVMKRYIVLIYFLLMLQKSASSVYCINNKSVFQWKNRNNSISLTEKDLKGTLVNRIYHSRNGGYFEKTSTVPLRRNWER